MFGMKDYNEKKECGTKTFGKGKDKVCIFGVGTSVSSLFRTCN